VLADEYAAARACLEACGGLASQADLGRRWGLTRQRVWQFVREPAFPEPVMLVNGQPVWLVDEAEDWRRHRELHIARARHRALSTSV